MFFKPISNAEKRFLIRVLTGDVAFAERVALALASSKEITVDVSVGALGCEASFRQAAMASLLLIDVGHGGAADLAALASLLQASHPPPDVIVVSERLDADVVRGFLKLQIRDWLPKTCSDRDIALACEQALKPAPSQRSPNHAQCTTFLPAVGGAGTTTLALAAASVLAGKARVPLSSCCVIDLNLQSGSLSDYLDLTPNLRLAEIGVDSARLDGQLLEVMLSRHASGLATLAASPSLDGFEIVGPDLIGRVLDLLSVKFANVIIDMPRLWLPWCENVLRGTDAFYIVTELTITGLRQALRLSDVLERDFAISTERTVIINKVSWLSRGGLKKVHATEMLGRRLAGFIGDCNQVRDAQNRGLLLSEVSHRNRIESDLKRLLCADRTDRAAGGVSRLKEASP